MSEEQGQSLGDDGPVSRNESLLEEYRYLFLGCAGEATDIGDMWRRLGRLPPEEAPCALCLSGGGIRSATFALGVMQALAGCQKLAGFHYLSTVSGGGYAGSWLSRWRRDDESWAESRMREPPYFETESAEAPPHPVRRLRSFSNYLAPIAGVSIDSLTIVSIFLRNLLVSLLIWVPLILAVAWLPRFLIVPAGGLARLCPSSWQACAQNPSALAAASLPVGLMAVWLVTAVFLLAARKWGDTLNEGLSRWSAYLLLGMLVWALWFGLFVVAPMIAWDWLRLPAVEAGLASAGLAVMTALAGYWSRHGPKIREKITGLVEQTGLRLLDILAAGVLVAIAFWAAIAVHYWIAWLDGASTGSFRALLESGHTGNIAIPLLLLLTAMFVGWLAGANRFSLHSLYGNRLVRAYLGTARKTRKPGGFSDFDPDDDLALSALAAKAPLFPVINMALNLTRPRVNRRDWQERKAASFTATPLRCGSEGLGFAPSATYAGGLTLGRAMTISGAAATPNMGYHSSPLVTLVMTLFNIRLGWWLPNPKPTTKDGIGESGPDSEEQRAGMARAARKWLNTPAWKRTAPGSGWLQVLREGLSRTNDASHWLYLSDGGHFENLGLYEMVRRRCRLIVVVDATCDGGFDHADLHNAVRKINVDFGIPIELPSTLSGQPGPGSKQRIMIGRICYSALGDDYPDGFLICLKPILTGNEPASLTHYAATSRRRGNTFPHHSTVDQFFNETQFESYRLLGELSGRELCGVLEQPLPATSPGLPDEPRVYYPNFVAFPEPEVLPPSQTEPDGPPPPALTGAGQLADGVKSLSAGGLMATGLTAVATIGVAGTLGLLVTLKLVAEPLNLAPAVVSLADEDRELLKQGLQLNEDRAMLARLAELQAVLDLIAEDLNRDTASPAAPDLSALTEQIAILSARIDALARRPGEGARDPAINAQLTAISSRVNEIQGSLGRLPDSQERERTRDLLRQLNERLRTIGPRTSVRGQ